MELKKELAFRLTSELKSKEDAESAQEYFESVFQNKSTDTDLKEVEVNQKEYDILELITEVNLAPSKSQARRLIEQNAVSINNKKVDDWQKTVTLTQPITLKVGKKIIQLIHQP
jgi:tyrosyl-tRNA synthetase